MQNDISVAALCLNLEQKLMEVWNNELTLERYRKVLAEFTVFAGNSSYSQSLGADFLIARFTERGGLVSTDEHSRKEETYFRCMRMLAEYHNLSTDGMIFLVKSSGQGHSVNVQKGFLRPS